MTRRHRPFDVVDTPKGWRVVSRAGHYRPWSPAMTPGLARLRGRQPDTREFIV